MSPERQKGESLGTFTVTAYNIANEADHSDAVEIPALGLNETYSHAFLKDILMQGSGVDKKGRLIQIDWGKNKPKGPTDTIFTYVAAIRGALGKLENGVSIAVDPTVVTAGTWVYIDTVGWRRADDTGGRIKGKHIDLFMLVPRAQAMAWGKKELQVWKEG
ncbi:MAG TPA: 3D domain-containing protein [Candidatus Brocadiia bacterium]|nr:3D domain-containing protein [Candidatus Brocadiia bacterium]